MSLAMVTSRCPCLRRDTHGRGVTDMVAVIRVPSANATLTSGAAAEKSRAVCPPRTGRVRDPHLVTAVDIDVLDVRVPQVPRQRTEPVALIVDRLGQGVPVRRGRNERARPGLPLRPGPDRLADQWQYLLWPGAVIEPAGNQGEDVGNGPAQPGGAEPLGAVRSGCAQT
jgi:hypothetical protein